ncbi:MAG: GNAT family N-acetyltransferase [Candidatus Buchananbacteria bacterium]
MLRLRKPKPADKKYFAKWWRDQELIKLTSGQLRRISDPVVDKSFWQILHSPKDFHYMITLGAKVIGHLALVRSRLGWYETQIVIGEKKYWGQGYGTKAIKLLLSKVVRLGISKIYLEVRPNNFRAIKAYEKCGFVGVGIKKYPKNKNLPQTLKMVFNKIYEK